MNGPCLANGIQGGECAIAKLRQLAEVKKKAGVELADKKGLVGAGELYLGAQSPTITHDLLHVLTVALFEAEVMLLR